MVACRNNGVVGLTSLQNKEMTLLLIVWLGSTVHRLFSLNFNIHWIAITQIRISTGI